MIVRTWRGATRAADAGEYAGYVSRTGLAAYAAVPGFMGAELLMRPVGDIAEFAVVSRWTSMAAVRAFAGDDPSQAVFYPEDHRYLVAFDASVTHWEVLAERAHGAASVPPTERETAG